MSAYIQCAGIPAQSLGEPRVQMIISDDIEALCTAISSIPKGIVMFDGVMHAGKTRQACMVASRLNLPHIELDNYIREGNQGNSYVEMIQCCSDQIKQDIDESTKHHRLVIIS